MTNPQTQRWSHLASSIERLSATSVFAVALTLLLLSHCRYLDWRWRTGVLSIWRGGVRCIETTSKQRLLIERFRSIGRPPRPRPHPWNRWTFQPFPSRGGLAEFPFWPCVLILGLRATFAWSRPRRANTNAACHNCGYDRRGLPNAGAHCPECGLVPLSKDRPV